MRNDIDKIQVDVAAINLMRSRDHGIPGYNRVREYTGLSRIANFDALFKVKQRPTLAAALQALYTTPDEMDAWIGGVLEEPDNGLLGSLFSRNIKDQFERLMLGDRFWFENLYSGAELNEIKNVSISSLLDKNFEGFNNITNAFDPLTESEHY